MAIAENSQALFAKILVFKKNVDETYPASSYKAGCYSVYAFEEYIFIFKIKKTFYKFYRGILLGVGLIRLQATRNDSTSLKTLPAILPRTIPCIL